MEERKKYILQNLNTPTDIFFPSGRKEYTGVKNGDVVELTDFEAEKLLRKKIIKLKKSKGAK